MRDNDIVNYGRYFISALVYDIKIVKLGTENVKEHVKGRWELPL